MDRVDIIDTTDRVASKGSVSHIWHSASWKSYCLVFSNDQIIRQHTDHICPSEVNSDDTSKAKFDNVLNDVLLFTTSQPPTPGCCHSQRDHCPLECL